MALFTGYPEKTFQGQRALTRYEFAVATQRMVDDYGRLVSPEKQVPAQGPVDRFRPSGTPPETAQRKRLADPATRRQTVEQLLRLTHHFQNELAMLGVDLIQIRRDLHASLAVRP